MEDMKQRIKRGNLEQEKSDAIKVGKLWLLGASSVVVVLSDTNRPFVILLWIE